MKRTEPKLLSDIIDEAMQQAGLTETMAEQRASYVWSEIMGPMINRCTSRRRVANGVLHVWLTSAPMKQELSFHKSEIVRKINEAVGSEAISSIEFH